MFLMPAMFLAPAKLWMRARSASLALASAALLMAGLAGSAVAAPAAAQPAVANELTLYAIPAPNPAELTWRTPGGLIRRVLVNEVGTQLHVFNRKIGHAGVSLRCAAFGDRAADSFLGSVRSTNKSEFADVVMKKQYGLGLLFFGFSGRMERPEELQETLDERYRNGRAAYVRFAISPQTCHRLLDYVREYQRLNVAQTYGLSVRPLYREGAGCSAFSMSFLEIANLVEPRFRAGWGFNVRVPYDMIGGPLGGNKKVSIFKLALTGRPWAAPSEPGIDLFGWDPTQMFHWIRDAVEVARRSPGTADRVEWRGRAPGLFLDRRAVAPTTGPFWKN